MTKFHHITLFFLFFSLSLAITLPLTIELSPGPPVSSPYSAPEPVPPNSAPSQLLPPPSINGTGTSSNTSDANSYDCFKMSPFAPARPLYNDCQAAIRLLPIDTTSSQFQYVKNPHLAIPNPTPTNSQKSSGNPSDAYRLPRFEDFGTCRLIIGLDNTATRIGETASWTGVRQDAQQLNQRCVQYGILKEFYGGKTTSGEHGLITVVLLYSGVGDNETEVASS